MSAKKTVMVVDGQGGGLGKAVIEKINKAGLSVRVIAIGTNSAATMAMLRAGADDAATGENAIIVNARDADCIIGANGIVAANSMFGEITCAAACAVASSGGLKLLIPVNKCNLFLVGVKENGLGEKIDEAIEKMKLELSL